MKRKAAGILFMVLLVLPLASSYTYLKYQKSLVRKAVKERIIEGMDRKELVLLAFSIEESKTILEWEHPWEFEFGGQMYDVVEKEIGGDTVRYWCFHDSEETDLNVKIDDLIARGLINSPQKKEKQNKIVEFITKLYCTENTASSFMMQEQSKRYLSYDEYIIRICYPPPVPPPRVS